MWLYNARCWREHSLTIVSAAVGLLFLGLALPFREGTAFDVIVGLGHGALSIALLGFLSGPFRERNKSDE